MANQTSAVLEFGLPEPGEAAAIMNDKLRFHTDSWDLSVDLKSGFVEQEMIGLRQQHDDRGDCRIRVFEHSDRAVRYQRPVIVEHRPGQLPDALDVDAIGIVHDRLDGRTVLGPGATDYGHRIMANGS